MSSPSHHIARFIRGATAWNQLPTDGKPEVAFIGRSNVGKSSLLNMLFRSKDLAKVSSTPGKTQQFNFFDVDERFYLVDLPGYGYARTARTNREAWGQFIGRYLTEREPLSAVLHLIDGRHAPMTQDLEIMEFMRGSTVPYVVLLTKADKLSGNERARNLAATRATLAELHLQPTLIYTSAQDGRGREDVWKWIELLTTTA